MDVKGKTIHKLRSLIAMSLLLLLMLSLFAPVANATESNKGTTVKTVKVGYFNFQEYMLGAAEGEAKSGYAYELLHAVAGINNWKYEFVYGDFNDLYEKLLNGEIDILPCIVYTEERAALHLFSEEEIYFEQYYVSTLKENAKNFKSIEDLDGKKISSVAGANQNKVFDEWEKKNGINATLVNTSSYEDSWKLLDEGKVDFILNVDNASQASDYTSLFKVGAGSSRLAIAPNREDIKSELDNAIDLIYEISPFTMSHLKEKYLTGTLSSYKLSDEELEWLANKKVIRLAGFVNDAPYTYTDKDGNVVGVYPEMVDMIFEKLGVDIEIEWTLYKDLNKMHKDLKEGKIDLVCPDYLSTYYAETNDIVLSEEIHRVNMGILFKEDMKEKNIKKIATPSTKLGIYYVTDNFTDVEIIKCKSVEDCIAAVVSGKADAAIAHVAALQEKSVKYLRPFTVNTLVAGCPICFSSNHNSGTLLLILNRGIHLISASELQTLEIKHSPNNGYEFWNFLKENILFVAMFFIAIFIVIIYAIDRNMSSRKLKKNLGEITRQKEIIEADEIELVAAKDAANMASRAKSTFLFNMSHDIRTPMNAILGYSDRMLRHIDDEEIVADSARKIKSSGEYLLSLINDVLDMARIESDKTKIEPTINDIKAKGLLLCDVFEVDMQKKDLTFNVDFNGIKDNLVWYDTLKLRQVMLNLISNAVKYTQVGGTITHTVRQLPSDIPGNAKFEIVVADNGMGMSQEFLDHIFDQFSRSDDSITKETQGTGLGMSIVGKIIDLMNGKIDIQSEVGKGTKITVFLDLKIATEEEIREYYAANEPVKKEISLEGLRILLVDDNELNREIAQDILTEEGCIVVDIAENGKIAVEKVAESSKGKYDVVLMDVQMPVMDGYEATKVIRELENKDLANIPIVAMTANAFDEDRQNALNAGMNAHIAKPIDISVLARTLSEYVKLG